MSDDKRAENDERSLSKHILPSSGTMIGVCATLIGLVKLAEAHIGPSRVDEYTALASMLFLASAIASYMSIRHSDQTEASQRCEVIATPRRGALFRPRPSRAHALTADRDRTAW
jgi:hypothetical protein